MSINRKITTDFISEVINRREQFQAITAEQLLNEEQPFLGIELDNSNHDYQFEITLTFGGSNIFLYVNHSGNFKIEGWSPFYVGSFDKYGYNPQLSEYLDQLDIVSI
jgi:hypothetical protein